MSEEVIYLCMPSYSAPEASSARQFWARCVDPRGKNVGLTRIQDDQGGSLLAYTFNQHWARALTLQAAGSPIRYFGMMHSDVSPQDWWLDVLLEDLKSSGADLMAAVINIKDGRGLTSAAIDDPSNPYKVVRRITTGEMSRLPDVFDARDCGYPDNFLLANTGCWICDFTKPWRLAENEDGSLKVFFDINDRIVRIPAGKSADPEVKTDVFVAENASEDWNFSRRIGKLGGKVACTKRVHATHWGKMPYHNTVVFGLDYDKDILGPNVTPIGHKESETSADAVAGWMQPQEMDELVRLADGKTVLEIGSYCGLSTIHLAQRAASVYAVDTFDGRGTASPRDTYEEFCANVVKFGVADKVVAVRMPIEEAERKLDRIFDLVFIDGAHDFYSVLRDSRIAKSKLRDGGLLVYHDYTSGNKRDDGVRQAVDSLVAGGDEIIEKCGSMVVVKPGREILEAEDHDFGDCEKQTESLVGV